MEPVERSHLLVDLALIYLTMAHGTDEDLDNAEIDTIADLLHNWEAEASHETALESIKSALNIYARPEALDEVNQAIDNVRQNLSDHERQQIMDDLVEIAMADGRFLHAESELIGELSRAWDVSLQTPDESRMWSIFRPEGPHEQWTPVHDLTLVYITIAYETDSDLSDEEVDTIAAKISEWVPGASENQVMGIVNNVISTYVQKQDDLLFADSVAALRETVPEHQREPLLRDLQDIAYADGQLLEEEERMIRDLAREWGVEWSAEEGYEEFDEEYGGPS